MLSEKKARFKQLPNMIPFIAQSGKMYYRDRMRISGCPGWRKGYRREGNDYKQEKTFWNDENVLCFKHGNIE